MLTPETVTAIQTALTPLAEKIGQGASYGWEVVVRQQYVEGIMGLAGFGLFAVMLVIALVMLSLVPWEEKTSEVKPREWIFTISSCVLGFISVMGFLFSLIHLFAGNVIGKLLNPEFYALQFFMGLIK